MSADVQPTPRRARTQQRLVQAATAVVAEHGYQAASVAKIAERAGLSIGALYANFSAKDELLLAVFDGHLAWFAERLQDARRTADSAAAIADWLDALSSEPDQFHVFIEFWAYAVRKPAIRPQFAQRMDQMRDDLASVLTQRAQATGEQPPLSPQLTALLAIALGRGLALEKLARPDAVPDQEIAHLIAELLG